jgi:hypothetical protein
LAGVLRWEVYVAAAEMGWSRQLSTPAKVAAIVGMCQSGGVKDKNKVAVGWLLAAF